jgi:7-cyano-7-deazaguanine tRNA-ribosyltransferase
MHEFEVTGRDGLARLGRFPTPHGTLRTPALLPVVHPDPRRQAIPPQEIRRLFGLEAVITSSYIAWRTPELRNRAEEVGIHGLIDFDGPVMTDSGAFQQHAYGSVEVAPEAILAFQGRIGTDIATVLDIFVEPDADHDRAERGVATTTERARAAREHRAGLLAVPVQGGRFPDLRQRSAEEASATADLLAVGGVVPLLEQYRFAELARELLGARPGLAPEHPVHLFGTGHPMTFAFAALLGVDLFDSASYHKFARRDALLFPEGTVALDSIREPICGCSLCARHPLETVHELPAAEREAHLARHNLWMCALEVRRVRQAIRDGQIWELAERRAAAHPALLAGLRAAVRGARVLVPAEPVARNGFRATSPTSTLRPSVIRFLARLRSYLAGRSAYRTARRVPLTPGGIRHRPTADAAGRPIEWDCRTPIGAVPLELTDVYPIGCWIGVEDFEPAAEPEAADEALPTEAPEQDWTDRWAARQMAAQLEWQFGPEAAAMASELRGVRSPRSGRLRGAEGPRGLEFGFGVGAVPRPTWRGAQRLHRALAYPRARIVVDPDAVPFVGAGRSLFSAFVRGGDSSLAPGAPALLVDPDDHLLAVGRLRLAPYEMGRLRRGVAVEVTAHAHALEGPSESPPEELAAAPPERENAFDEE